MLIDPDHFRKKNISTVCTGVLTKEFVQNTGLGIRSFALSLFHVFALLKRAAKSDLLFHSLQKERQRSTKEQIALSQKEQMPNPGRPSEAHCGRLTSPGLDSNERPRM